MHSNSALQAIVFRLRPGTVDKLDESSHVLLKSFPYMLINEDTQQLAMQELQKIYHHMPLSAYDAQKTDFENILNFQGSATQETEWTEKLPPDQQVYMKFSKISTTGCGHYIRHCEICCPKCKKFYTCRFCHNDVEDHELDRRAVDTVRCMACCEIQPAGSRCRACGTLFGTYYCDKCHLFCSTGPDAKPNYHCEHCGFCVVGIREWSHHCFVCKSCYNVLNYGTHRCAVVEEQCMICMGGLGNSIYGRVMLECGHQLHGHCYQSMINMHNLRCPICKRFLPVQADRAAILRWQTHMYRKIFIPDEFCGRIVRIKCNDCQREFDQQLHPLLYYCPYCRMFNCEVVGDSHATRPELMLFNSRFDNFIQPRYSTEDDLREVVLHLFKIPLEDLLSRLHLHNTQESVGRVCDALNRLPRTLDELGALVQAGLDDNGETR